MAALNNTLLHTLPERIRAPRYDRAQVTPGIAHFSVGNFHRAHQALYLDDCLHRPGQQGWGILGIGLLDNDSERAKAAGLHAQHGLYSLTQYPPQGAAETRVVGSIVEYLHAPHQPQTVLERLCDPAIRIVSMTITEGGYNIDDATGTFRLDNPDIAHDLAHPHTPRTVFGYVVQALAQRRAQGVAPFTVLSCDNLRMNGDVARKAFLSFAHARDPELAAWIEANVTFPNSMVDRITPATLDKDAARLNAHNALEDHLPVFAEDFVQWVVEDKFCNGRPDFEAVGVQMTDDVHDYEQMKLRMLNASHNMLCFPGLVMGYRLAHEAMADAHMHRLLDGFMDQDVIPLLKAPKGEDLPTYKRTVLARFGNPNIGDQLLRIASDGASKLPVFVQDTLRTSVRRQRDIRRLAFLVAGFGLYLRGVDENGVSFPVVEPHLTQEDLRLAQSNQVEDLLNISVFRDWELTESPTFVAELQRQHDAMRTLGARAAMRELLVNTGLIAETV